MSSPPPPSKSRLVRIFRVVLPVLLVAALGAYFVMPAAWRTVRDVTTGATGAYPDLQPHVYDMGPDQIVILTSAVASRLPGWRVVRTDRATGVMTAQVAGPLGMSSEVTARVEPQSPDVSRVVIRSRSISGVGPGDWGVNARNIRALQSALDDKLPVARP